VNTNYDLLIFGEGEERNKLQLKINNLNLEKKVFLMGYSEPIYYYMKNAEALILSSLWEDPGFVLIEAAFCNLFIISSNCKNGPTEFLNMVKEECYLKAIKKMSYKK
jgi:glycosyltransferase involved in cell wall biosynthesis